MTVMGEALMDGLSDAGSTPARSIGKIHPLLVLKSIADGFFTSRIVVVAFSVLRSQKDTG